LRPSKRKPSFTSVVAATAAMVPPAAVIAVALVTSARTVTGVPAAFA
jgi:hypothetical protein